MTSANSSRRAAPIDSPDAGRAMSLGRLAVPHLDAAETRITESEPDAKQPDHTAPAHRVASNFPSDFSHVAPLLTPLLPPRARASELLLVVFSPLF